jgi:hypothetical protein
MTYITLHVSLVSTDSANDFRYLCHMTSTYRNKGGRETTWPKLVIAVWSFCVRKAVGNGNRTKRSGAAEFLWRHQSHKRRSICRYVGHASERPTTGICVSGFKGNG